MLLWITAILLVVGILLITCTDSYRFEDTGWFVTIVSSLALAVMLFIIVFAHATSDAYVATNEERYEALCYKAYSEYCRDEFGLLNKEVVDEIQNWNEDLVRFQSLQKDFWLGIFYPNVYDQFETIEYSEIK